MLSKILRTQQYKIHILLNNAHAQIRSCLTQAHILLNNIHCITYSQGAPVETTAPKRLKSQKVIKNGLKKSGLKKSGLKQSGLKKIGLKKLFEIPDPFAPFIRVQLN